MTSNLVCDQCGRSILDRKDKYRACSRQCRVILKAKTIVLIAERAKSDAHLVGIESALDSIESLMSFRIRGY